MRPSEAIALSTYDPANQPVLRGPVEPGIFVPVPVPVDRLPTKIALAADYVARLDQLQLLANGLLRRVDSRA